MLWFKFGSKFAYTINSDYTHPSDYVKWQRTICNASQQHEIVALKLKDNSMPDQPQKMTTTTKMESERPDNVTTDTKSSSQTSINTSTSSCHPRSAVPSQDTQMIYPPSPSRLAAAESRLRACGVLLDNYEVGEFILDKRGLQIPRHSAGDSIIDEGSIIDELNEWFIEAQHHNEESPLSHIIHDVEEIDEIKNKQKINTFFEWLEEMDTTDTSKQNKTINNHRTFWRHHIIAVLLFGLQFEIKSKKNLAKSRRISLCSCFRSGGGKRAWSDAFWLGFYLPDVIKWFSGPCGVLGSLLAQQYL
jgi:hypothetical protein